MGIEFRRQPSLERAALSERPSVPLRTCHPQKGLMTSFCKGQIPHKSVNFFVILVMMKDKLTDLCGN